ncbi:hypothetical protein NDU88_009458 [Pleurodeles waltl]|uniref:Uncharacterized protein n=1 Tax=Pleurodeles waltl TaxID=8319 RepID=A0AAV7QUN1_PLEWA|nr:hypothetical protein NDU88_009458 [Pleurodeles waltl]
MLRTWGRQLPLGASPRSTRLGNRSHNEEHLTAGLASAGGERRDLPRMRAESLPGHGDMENLSDRPPRDRRGGSENGGTLHL